MASAEQTAWEEIAATIRAGISRAATYLPAMKPDEIKAFVEAARAAYCLEINAVTFDDEVEESKKKLTRGFE